jgi:hypothetical protein
VNGHNCFDHGRQLLYASSRRRSEATRPYTTRRGLPNHQSNPASAFDLAGLAERIPEATETPAVESTHATPHPTPEKRRTCDGERRES